jgi:hypothetical protein
MPICFVHNDPGCVPLLQTASCAPTPMRSGALAAVTLANACAEDSYALGTPEFVQWQCREAALRAIAAWERVAPPLRFWQGEQRVLPLVPERAAGFQAMYDRASLGFDTWDTGEGTFFVAASADAVSHEVGHAILDARRPELWDSYLGEVAAFHEGFADCVSLLTTLFDDVAAANLFQGVAPENVLGPGNPASLIAESLAGAVAAELGPGHPAAVPRELKNSLKWAIPTTLPVNPLPTNLSREPHSFGRVFAGCFYDCVENIYRSAGVTTVAGLQLAATTAGNLLAAAIESAPVESRFFRSIGRAMVHADSVANAGQNHLAIRDAFAAHNVALGSAAQLAPSVALDGPVGSSAASSAELDPGMARDLVRRLGVGSRVKVAVNRARIGAERVFRATVKRQLDVGALIGGRGRRTRGRVLVPVQEDVLIGSHNRRHVVLGELPNAIGTEEEVCAFVEWLAHARGLDSTEPQERRTHTLLRRGDTQRLRRIAFNCS